MPDIDVMQDSQHSRLVSAQAVADACGVHVSTVYRAAQAGTLPAVKVGGAYRFDPEAVAAAAVANVKEHN